MNKVLQAAGRVIRTREDHGVILLLDERFRQREYSNLFPVEWNDRKTCTLSNVEAQLQKFWESIPDKSLTNCDVHFAESLLQTHYRVCKNIMANKEVAYKAETGYTALIKRRIT